MSCRTGGFLGGLGEGGDRRRRPWAAQSTSREAGRSFRCSGGADRAWGGRHIVGAPQVLGGWMRVNDEEGSLRGEGQGWGTDGNNGENEDEAARGETGRAGGPTKGLNSGLETEQDRTVLAAPPPMFSA